MKIRTCFLVARSIKCSEDYECFNDYFTLTQSSTRNSQLLLLLPRFKLEVGKNSFKFMGAKIFNDLPLNVLQG